MKFGEIPRAVKFGDVMTARDALVTEDFMFGDVKAKGAREAGWRFGDVKVVGMGSKGRRLGDMVKESVRLGHVEYVGAVANAVGKFGDVEPGDSPEGCVCGRATVSGHVASAPSLA